ncbi:hypothetical protein RFI_17995, partial [Reticulomyxa filosa]
MQIQDPLFDRMMASQDFEQTKAHIEKLKEEVNEKIDELNQYIHEELMEAKKQMEEEDLITPAPFVITPTPRTLDNPVQQFSIFTVTPETNTTGIQSLPPESQQLHFSTQVQMPMNPIVITSDAISIQPHYTELPSTAQHLPNVYNNNNNVGSNEPHSQVVTVEYPSQPLPIPTPVVVPTTYLNNPATKPVTVQSSQLSAAVATTGSTSLSQQSQHPVIPPQILATSITQPLPTKATNPTTNPITNAATNSITNA